MNSFTATLVATAALCHSTMAQLPRECFFATQMHGPHDADSALLSDLPSLMASFIPGMLLQKITAFQDVEDGDFLTGLQTTLYDYDEKIHLELPVVGAIEDNYVKVEVDLLAEPADRISFITTEQGICNVVIYQGRKTTYLNQDVDGDCEIENKGVYETMLRIPEETPLVGFHAMSDDFGMASLGAIFVDTMSSMCRTASWHNLSSLKGLNEFEASNAAESGITEAEKTRAKALETLLKYDSMMKARETKEMVNQQIKDLLAQEPIKTVNGKPASVVELQLVMDRIQEYKVSPSQRTADRFVTLFDDVTKLHAHDKEAFTSTKLPVSVGEVKTIYDSLAHKMGQPAESFQGKNLDQHATTADLYVLLTMLSDHFEFSTNEMYDLDASDEELLMKFFGKLADHYGSSTENDYDDEDDYDNEDDYDEEDMEPVTPVTPFPTPTTNSSGNQELSQVYSELAKMFGRGSEFELEEREIQQMYDMIRNDEMFQTRLEGEMISNFEDLKNLEERSKGNKIQELLKEMHKFENIEQQNQGYIENESDRMGATIEGLLNNVHGEEERIKTLESMLMASQKNAQREENYSRNAFQQLSDQIKAQGLNNLGSSNTAVTTDKAKEENMASFSAAMKDEGTKLMLGVMAVLAIAIFVGIAFGACCIFCVRNCCRANQKKRLEEAKQDPKNTFHFRAQSSARNETLDGESRTNPTRIDSMMEISPNTNVAVSGSGEQDNGELKSSPTKIMGSFTDNVKEVRATEEDSNSSEEPEFLTQRGLNFKAPEARRATYQHKLSGLSAVKNPPKQNSKRDLYQ